MTMMTNVKERVEMYQESSEVKDLIQLMFPRSTEEQVNSLNDMSFVQFINMTKNDFKDLGFTKNTAEKLEKMVFLFKKLRKNDCDAPFTIRSPKDAAQLFTFLEGNMQEEFWVAYLNIKNQVIRKEMIFKGSLNSSIVHPREVFKNAIKLSAASIVVCHNHPSGNPAPSPEDIAVTKRLMEVGSVVGIELLDHIIIGQQTHISLNEKGFMN